MVGAAWPGSGWLTLDPGREGCRGEGGKQDWEYELEGPLMLPGQGDSQDSVKGTKRRPERAYMTRSCGPPLWEEAENSTLGFLLGNTDWGAGIGGEGELGWGKGKHEDRGSRHSLLGELIVRPSGVGD